MSQSPSPASPHTVFVSHAHADNSLCDRYVDALRSFGLDIWYDRNDLQGGHQLTTEIETQLELRTAFVVMLTPASVASYWVKMETAAFRALAAQEQSAQQRLLLPVRLEDCKVPLLMQGTMWIDAVSMPFESAVSEIAKALGVMREPDELLAHGKHLLNHNREAEALASFVRAAEISPGNAEAWAYAGRTYAALNRVAEGLDASERALLLDPTSASAWCSKGLCLSHTRQRQAAMEAIEQALRYDPTDASAWYAKGIVLSLANRHQQALESFSRAIQHDPDYVPAWVSLAGVQSELRQFEDAIVSADRALALHSLSASALFNKALAIHNLKRDEHALQLFDRVIELQPHHARAWSHRAAALRRLGRVAEADEAERRAWELRG